MYVKIIITFFVIVTGAIFGAGNRSGIDEEKEYDRSSECEKNGQKVTVHALKMIRAQTIEI